MVKNQQRGLRIAAEKIVQLQLRRALLPARFLGVRLIAGEPGLGLQKVRLQAFSCRLPLADGRQV